MKETIKHANYKYVRYMGSGEHLLMNESGKLEIWYSNRNHASWGLIYKNTHLEFAREYKGE